MAERSSPRSSTVDVSSSQQDTHVDLRAFKRQCHEEFERLESAQLAESERLEAWVQSKFRQLQTRLEERATARMEEVRASARQEAQQLSLDVVSLQGAQAEHLAHVQGLEQRAQEQQLAAAAGAVAEGELRQLVEESEVQLRSFVDHVVSSLSSEQKRLASECHSAHQELRRLQTRLARAEQESQQRTNETQEVQRRFEEQLQGTARRHSELAVSHDAVKEAVEAMRAQGPAAGGGSSGCGGGAAAGNATVAAGEAPKNWRALVEDCIQRSGAACDDLRRELLDQRGEADKAAFEAKSAASQAQVCAAEAHHLASRVGDQLQDHVRAFEKSLKETQQRIALDMSVSMAELKAELEASIAKPAIALGELDEQLRKEMKVHLQDAVEACAAQVAVAAQGAEAGSQAVRERCEAFGVEVQELRAKAHEGVDLVQQLEVKMSNSMPGDRAVLVDEVLAHVREDLDRQAECLLAQGEGARDRIDSCVAEVQQVVREAAGELEANVNRLQERLTCETSHMTAQLDRAFSALDALKRQVITRDVSGTPPSAGSLDQCAFMESVRQAALQEAKAALAEKCSELRSFSEQLRDAALEEARDILAVKCKELRAFAEKIRDAALGEVRVAVGASLVGEPRCYAGSAAGTIRALRVHSQPDYSPM